MVQLNKEVMMNKFKKVVAFGGIYIVWGTTFLAISFGLSGFPPFLLSGLRFLIAGTILMIFRCLHGERPNIVSNWKRNAVSGVLILTAGTGILSWAEQYVPSTEACVMEAVGPFLFILMDKTNWKAHFSNKLIIAGLLIGFVGVLIFVSGSMGKKVELDPFLKLTGILAIMISLLFWVSGSLFSKKYAASQSIAMNTAQQLLAAGVISVFISLITGEQHNFSFTDVPLKAWSGLFYLVFFGSIMAYFSYQYLLSIKSAVIVSTYTYINPIVAMLVGWLLADESISTLQLFGLGVILSGVLLTNMHRYLPSVNSKHERSASKSRNQIHQLS